MLQEFSDMFFLCRDLKLRYQKFTELIITGATTYPEDIFNQFREVGVDFVSVNALELAEQAGSAKASNVVLMGVVSTKMSIEKEVWLKALEECVPAKFLELNKKAFELGRECY